MFTDTEENSIMFSSQNVFREKKKKEKKKKSTDRPSFSFPCLGKQNFFCGPNCGTKSEYEQINDLCSQSTFPRMFVYWWSNTLTHIPQTKVWCFEIHVHLIFNIYTVLLYYIKHFKIAAKFEVKIRICKVNP